MTRIMLYLAMLLVTPCYVFASSEQALSLISTQHLPKDSVVIAIPSIPAQPEKVDFLMPAKFLLKKAQSLRAFQDKQAWLIAIASVSSIAAPITIILAFTTHRNDPLWPVITIGTVCLSALSLFVCWRYGWLNKKCS